MDTNTSKPLPFGTLGVHKVRNGLKVKETDFNSKIFQKAAFEHASVCLFVFDCLLYNGKSLLDK